MKPLRLIGPFSVAVTLSLALTAQAQQEAASEAQSAGALEEVLVTATKRGAQVLQDIPAQIQAFTAADLEATGATEFVDIATQIPSLQFQDLGPGDKEYIIRGVNSTATATVGVYYDEAVITARSKQDGGGRQADIELHDIERVEVLKGPQGTLYGASSMSGTIRFIPYQPDPTKFESRVEGTVSYTEDGDDNWKANAMVNIPVVQDKFALRGVGWITREGGYVDNTFLGLDDINDNEVEGAKLAANWLVNDNLTVTAFGISQDREVGGTSRQMPILQPLFESNLDAFGYPDIPPAERTVQSFTQDFWDEELNLFGLKAEYDTGRGSFLFASNWYNREVFFNFDSTPILLFFGVPVPAVTTQPQERETFTTEVRYASNLGGAVEFVVGGFLSREDKSFASQVLAAGPDGLPLAPFEPGDPNTIFGRDKFDNLDQEAFFGELEWRVTDALTLLFGGRFYQFDISSENVDTQPFFARPSGGFEPTFNVDDDKFTGKFSASYDLSDNKLVYFTASQGFRPGGTNDVAFVGPDDPVPPPGFGPDELWNYEFGWKTRWYDGRLTFNGAVFFIRWDDIQTETFDPNSPFNVVRNEGEASIDGIEFELRGRPTDNLQLFFAGSYQDAQFDTVIPGAGEGAPFADPGDDIPNVPEFQFSANAEYTHQAFGNKEAFYRFEWAYRDDAIIAPNDPVLNVKLDSYNLLNLRTGLRGDRWTAALFVRNLTDEDAVFDAINSPQDPRAILTARPRTIGVNMSYRFD